MRLILLIIGVGLLLASPPGSQAGDATVTMKRDLAYGDHPRHTLDLYLPAAAPAPYPTLLMIHGGGFRFGDKRSLTRLAEHFAGQGFAVIAPNYRLAAADRDHYPAQIEDVFCARAWVAASAAQFGLDAARLAVVGESAGGYLALALGTIDDAATYLNGCKYADALAEPEADPVRGVVSYYPLTGIALTLPDYPRLTEVVLYDFAGVEPGERDHLRDRWQRVISPLNWLDATDPPLLLIHGLADSVVPPEDTTLLADALAQLGRPPDLLLIDGADHGFVNELTSPAGAQAVAAVESWLAGVLEAGTADTR